MLTTLDPIITLGPCEVSLKDLERSVGDTSHFLFSKLYGDLFACPEFVSHFIGNLYVFVVGVPRIKVFQIDSRHL